MKNTLPVLFILIAALSATTAQDRQSPTVQSGELFETISRMDSKLSDAFNAHNLDAMMAMFAEDLAFYQDNGGVSN